MNEHLKVVQTDYRLTLFYYRMTDLVMTCMGMPYTVLIWNNSNAITYLKRGEADIGIGLFPLVNDSLDPLLDFSYPIDVSSFRFASFIDKVDPGFSAVFKTFSFGVWISFWRHYEDNRRQPPPSGRPLEASRREVYPNPLVSGCHVPLQLLPLGPALHLDRTKGGQSARLRPTGKGSRGWEV